MKYIASISFGKDSLAMLIHIIENKLPLDEVIFCEVMATDTLSADLPEMVEFIKKAENILLKKYGIAVKHLKAKLTFNDYFYTKRKRGKHAGIAYGYPLLQAAWCNSRLKMKVLNEYYKSLGDDHITYIGYAADEKRRIARLKPHQQAPLVEQEITEAQAIEICRQRDLLCPLYDKFKRMGCWFCPKQSLASLRVIWSDYPKYWQMMLDWQKDSEIKFKPKHTLIEIDERFRKEKENANAGLDLGDCRLFDNRHNRQH